MRRAVSLVVRAMKSGEKVGVRCRAVRKEVDVDVDVVLEQLELVSDAHVELEGMLTLRIGVMDCELMIFVSRWMDLRRAIVEGSPRLSVVEGVGEEK